MRRLRTNPMLPKWSKLYTQPTVPELALEPAVAALGRPYRFQHPVFATGSIVDFALLQDRVIFEVDGKSHEGAEAEAKDRKRTRKLEKLGWVVARCTNADALSDPTSAVALMLMQARDRRAALNILKNASTDAKGQPND